MKKILVSYSSLSGNTRQLAEAIAAHAPEKCELFDIAQLEDESPEEVASLLAQYDVVLHGYWVDRGGPDARSDRYLRAINGKRVGLFATLGAYPDSDHARESVQRGVSCLDSSNKVEATFLCQGRISAAMKERIRQFPAGHPHGVDEKRLKRWADAESHPDAADLRAAVDAFRALIDAC